MITNQIIQYWHNPAIPPRIVRLMNTWKDFNGEFVHKGYHRAEARQYLQKVFGNEAVNAFDDCAFPAMEADLFRYAVLA